MSTQVTHSLVKALRGVPDLAPLDEDSLLHIVGVSANLFWPEGSIVFDAGTPSEALYLVLSGTVRIFERHSGGEQEVSRVGPGDSFGELSLLLQTTHTKVAQAAEDTELMVVPKESFEELLGGNPTLADIFRRRLEERLPVQGDHPDST